MNNNLESDCANNRTPLNRELGYSNVNNGNCNSCQKNCKAGTRSYATPNPLGIFRTWLVDKKSWD